MIPTRHALVAGLAAVSYGAAIYATLPAHPVVINDDFGYLRSIVESIQRGRPWTNDWLEPWSASLSLLAALVFRLTGSFSLATSGLTAALAAASFAGLVALGRGRGLHAAAAMAFAALTLTFPTVFWKSLEFTGLVLYVPCLIWAIWAFEGRRWLLFFAIWFVAVSSRQTAIAWLALPFAVVVAELGSRGWRALRTPAARVLAASAIAMSCLAWYMNSTHAQIVNNERLWRFFSIERAGENVTIGLAVALATGGLAAATFMRRLPSRADLFRWQRFATVGAVSAMLFLVVRSAELYFGHESYAGSLGRSYVWLLGSIAAGAWLFLRVELSGAFVLATLSALAIAGLRLGVTDYYLIDVAVFAFFAVRSAPASAAPRTLAVSSLWWATALTLAFFQTDLAFRLKWTLDYAFASSTLAERALRRHDIRADEIAFAPFGFIGWHLHPYFVATDATNETQIQDFMRYLRRGSVRLDAGDLFRGPEPDWSSAVAVTREGTVLESAIFPAGWFWQQRFTLVRAEQRELVPAGELTIDDGNYRRVIFPISDAEWRATIGSE